MLIAFPQQQWFHGRASLLRYAYITCIVAGTGRHSVILPNFCDTYFTVYSSFNGPDSSVGIATGYGLDGPMIESRWGARFSAPVQTGPGAHPASSTMGTGSFPGVKSGQGVTLTPQPLLVPLIMKE